jgi:nitrite reductase/ring-hydroxylating ferredoxin subunit
LPFAIAGAIRLDQQYQFHPQRYLQALAQTIPGDDSHVFEQTRALSLEEGSPNRVITDCGVVTARHVVIASAMPFPMHSLLFAKAAPVAHVVLAVRIGADSAPGGMFIRTDTPGVSFRSYRDTHGVTLIATGDGFTPGRGDPGRRYRLLREYVRRRFDVQQELSWWMNEDYSSMDRLPLIGRLTPQARIYSATGFSGWGLSNGTAAAQILADLILGRSNPYAALCNPRRWNLRSGGKRLVQNNAQVARDFIGDRLQHLHAKSADELARGEGALVRHHGHLSAAYRDDDGELHLYSPRCTHLGCLLRWNGAEKTWDCSCHGSRFDAAGQVLHGPAVRDMRARDKD